MRFEQKESLLIDIIWISFVLKKSENVLEMYKFSKLATAGKREKLHDIWHQPEHYDGWFHFFD